MPETQRPAVTRRRLKLELRELREQAKLSQAEVVKNFDWSLSKLVRIENGTVGVSVPDLMALTTLYGAEKAKVAELVALSRIAKESRWWTAYRQVVSPQMQQFLGFEADATHIQMFNPTMVPGLLQTKEYIDAISYVLSLQPLESGQLAGLKEVRLRRQEEVLGDEESQVTVLLDEAVLHREVGGPEVMAAQLAKLVELHTEDKISLGILPFGSGAHFGMNGAFHIMEFSSEPDDAILYIENASNSLTLQDKPELVLQYRGHFEKMAADSIQDTEAVELINVVIRDMKSAPH